ncbi:MAG: hypothetical protein QXG12_05135 [Thermoproteota archaeon]
MRNLKLYTERPEIIGVKANVIAGTEPENILEKTRDHDKWKQGLPL